MTIKSSGQLGLNGTCTGGSSARNQIGAEICKTAGTQLSINCSAMRTLAGVASGQIGYSNFYGKANRTSITYTFASNASNVSLNVSSGSAPSGGSVSGTYTAGKTCVTVKINSGVVIRGCYQGCCSFCGSANTISLNITGSSSGDHVNLINCGTIVGVGGNGGGGGYVSTQVGINEGQGVGGGSGGIAVKVAISTSITNNGTIAGGGGGGGGGGPNANYPSIMVAGSGGGGGGGYGKAGCGARNSSGSYGTTYPGNNGSTGGQSTGGAGGSSTNSNGAGGAGGAWGAVGNYGACGPHPGLGYGGNRGAAGYYICGNSFVTWTVTGTRYGLSK